MSATFGAELEMMHVEISRVPAAGDLAAPLVAEQNGATQSRRNALLRADADVSACLDDSRWPDAGRTLLWRSRRRRQLDAG
jgi:hypothetical protein